MRGDSGYVFAGIYVLRENLSFFRETLYPVWKARPGTDIADDPERYGHFDTTQFGELELRMYILIKAGLASKWELETCYSLDEALKLYALYIRDLDIQRIQAEEMRRG